MVSRKYPVDIQTFSNIIEKGYVYIDKTDLLWQLQDFATYVFLSRPRRFGKSLLTSTMESYFSGDRRLFEGLKIMEYEKEWKSYPVIHLDLSPAKGEKSRSGLHDTLMWLLKPYTAEYGDDADENSPGKRLTGIIRRAYQQTGNPVVVLIDEYDAPLLNALDDPSLLTELRDVLQELYVPLKANERYLRFCFITGITKFSQLSIFSTINNLKNISLNPRFSSICGITETEVRTVLSEDVHAMAKANGIQDDEMYEKIKNFYDGYHFSERSEDIYNPYSLLNSLQDQKIDSYWFSSGTPTFLISQLQHFRTDITAMECIETMASAFDQPTENMQDALPLLYQSGYLTIKSYDPELRVFTLSVPNQEVRIGLTECLIPAYTGMRPSDVQLSFASKFWYSLKRKNLNQALEELRSYLAGIPYVEGFKKKLEEVSAYEGFYEYTLYLIFSMLNAYVRTQVKCRGGAIDMVILMPDTTYVFELKTRGSADDALAQIDEKGYSLPYVTDGRNVVKVGMVFDIEQRSLKEWAIRQSELSGK